MIQKSMASGDSAPEADTPGITNPAAAAAMIGQLAEVAA